MTDPRRKDVIVRKAYPEGDAPDFEHFLSMAVHRTMLLSHEWALYARDRKPATFVLPLLVIQCPRVVDQKTLAEVVLDIHALITEEWPALDPNSVVHTIPECGQLPLRHLRPQEVAEDASVRAVIVHGVRGDWGWPTSSVLLSFLDGTDRDEVGALLARLLDLPLGERVPGSDSLNGVECFFPLVDWPTSRQMAASILDREHLLNRVGSVVVIDPSHSDGESEMGEGADDDGEFRFTSGQEDEGEKPARPSHQQSDLSSLAWDHEARPAPPAPTKFDQGRRKRDMVGTNSEERGSYGRFKPRPITPTHPAYSSGPPYLDDRWPMHVYRERDAALNPPRKPPIPLKVMSVLRPNLGIMLDPMSTEFSLFAHGGVWGAYDSLQSERVTQGEVATERLARPHSRNAERHVFSENGERYVLPTYAHHLTTDDTGVFPVALTALETRLMMYETSRLGAVAWYRNPSRVQPESLSVVFADLDRDPFQPTFLFFSTTPSKALMTALVDVYDHCAPDALDRLMALARYAAENRSRLQRIESLSLVNGEPRLLDLADGPTREEIEAGSTPEYIYTSRGERVPWAENRPRPAAPPADTQRPLGRLGGSGALQGSLARGQELGSSTTADTTTDDADSAQDTPRALARQASRSIESE